MGPGGPLRRGGGLSPFAEAWCALSPSDERAESLGCAAIRVLIDTTYARRAPFSGTGVYIRRLCEELRRLELVEVVEAANPRRREPAGGGLGSVQNLSRDLWWTGVELPRAAKRAGVQVLHHPLPAQAITATVAQVLTVVDLAFERLPDCFDRGYRTYAHVMHRAAARRAQAVVCISETTAGDVRELWNVAQERIVVAPLGPGQIDPEPGGASTRMADVTYFLYVGDAEPRKNLPVLLEGYRQYRRSAPQAPLELLLAGTAEASGAGIRVVGRPDRAQLRSLYDGAAAVIQPSLYEGFGLTALEAMSAGVPVLAARSPGLTEVCGDAAAYAEPRDAGSFAAQMLALSRDEPLRARLSADGRRRASRYSWEACARAHVRAYSLASGE